MHLAGDVGVKAAPQRQHARVQALGEDLRFRVSSRSGDSVAAWACVHAGVRRGFRVQGSAQEWGQRRGAGVRACGRCVSKAPGFRV